MIPYRVSLFQTAYQNSVKELKKEEYLSATGVLLAHSVTTINNH